MSKFYAVRKGRKTGVFTDWSEVKTFIDRFPKAEYKSFLSEREALDYLNQSASDTHDFISQEVKNHELYVFGGYEPLEKTSFYSVLIINRSKEILFQMAHHQQEQSHIPGFHAELLAIIKGLEWIQNNHINNVNIHYNYEGVQKWATKDWEAKQQISQWYVKELSAFSMLKVHWQNKDDVFNLNWSDMAREIAQNELTTYIQEKRKIKVNNDAETLYDLGLFKKKIDNPVLHEKVVLVTGKAGTGKTTFINQLIKKLNFGAVIAPTGIAAIQVNGETIHSFFNLPIEYIDPVDINREWIFSHQLKHLFYLTVLIIDEISMVRVDLIDRVDRILRLAKNKDLPFGGIFVILVGDLFQLPPVLKYGNDEEEEIEGSLEGIFPTKNSTQQSNLTHSSFQKKKLKDWLLNLYKGSFFFFAPVFSEKKLPIIELTKVYRQSEVDFLNSLNEIREGVITHKTLATFDQCVGFQQDAITLSPTKQLVNQINQNSLNQIKTKSFQFNATKIAVQNHQFPHDMPVEESLTFKPGAKVMLLSNLEKGRLVNGTIGIISKIVTPEAIHFPEEKVIQNTLNAKEGIYFISDEDKTNTEERIDKVNWKFYKYIYDPDEEKLVAKVIGEYNQIPLRLAWAITIHKSQGLTFERVSINLERTPFDFGQTYVALSRCRNLAGLALSRKLLENDIKVSPDVLHYIEKAKQEKHYSFMESFSL
jgi:viroplasmin and RNaseH domain-containing protein